MDVPPPPTPLDNALTKLKAAINTLPVKKRDIITSWLEKWSSLILREKGFKPELMPTYKRGDVVYVDFGWNIGNEYGGVHYSVVVEYNNPKGSGNILVVPFTSLEAGKTAADVSKHDVYLGSGIIPWTSLDTVAKPGQIRAVSKMRIVKPVKKGDKWVRLSPAHMDAIDDKIKQLTMKPTPPAVAEKNTSLTTPPVVGMIETETGNNNFAP